MGVAATFSRKTAEANGEVIGREDRALGIDVSLQPFVNIDRDLEFGRGYNTFGEDPFLTSEIGAAEIKGIQSQHVMAQVKHFVGYDSDRENPRIGDQTLHEVYVAPFDAAVRVGVASIMCSCMIGIRTAVGRKARDTDMHLVPRRIGEVEKLRE